MKNVACRLGLLLLLTSSALAWQPSGWVYFNWPYPVSFLTSAPAGGWTDEGKDGAGDTRSAHGSPVGARLSCGNRGGLEQWQESDRWEICEVMDSGESAFAPARGVGRRLRRDSLRPPCGGRRLVEAGGIESLRAVGQAKRPSGQTRSEFAIFKPFSRISRERAVECRSRPVGK
jgi:hypothetical protein